MKQNGAALGLTTGQDQTALPTKIVRAAVYSRKSLEDRVATGFSSIDAQREAGEEYVAQRAGRGWALAPGRYEDMGFSGATTERPALQRLLADIEARQVDVVVVHRVDRLSRSLLDFARLAELFQRYEVGFVSVTQEIDTTTSMGRLMLNVLFSFAQFEREMISERTSSKMRAARRRGKFTGGMILLGFDRHPEGRRLVVNDAEAERVREIFGLYLKVRSLVALAHALNERGWTTKAWTTKRGSQRTGTRFTPLHLRNLLRNPAYIGKVHLDGQSYDAEHPGIVDPTVFMAVQALLAQKAAPGSPGSRTQHHAILSGILRCAPCDELMTYTHTKRQGRLYGYYACRTTRKAGWDACRTKAVPARAVERLVIDQIRVAGMDPAVQAATLESVRELPGGQDVREEDLRRALSLWDEVWAALLPKEQARVLALLVERIAYDGSAGTLSVTFRPAGIPVLAQEVAP